MPPSRRDIRLRLGGVIVSLQILGQTVLGFRLSIAQILVCLGSCALIEIAVSLWRQRALIWPASAILTGNSVAFILRTDGTRHGDWWSLNGIQYFLLACGIAMLSKYLIRPGGRHAFNPSNLGLVLCLLLAGVEHVYPQYLWWGPVGVPVGLALGVIAVGVVVVVRPVGMGVMAVSFLAPFCAGVALLAHGGQCFAATWSVPLVCGPSYWVDICASPEVLIFVLFMMSDPRTAPGSQPLRAVYGAGTSLVAIALLSIQPTEFGIKLSILASLTVVCAIVSIGRQVGLQRGRGRLEAAVRVVRAPSVVAAVVLAALVTIAVQALAGDPRVLDVEQTPALPGMHSPQ